MDRMREMDERWLERARFEGPFGEKEASGKLLERYAFSEGWQVRDLETYGLLFVLPLVGEPAKGYLVVAEHDLANSHRAIGWICSRLGWESKDGRVMVGRCVPTKEGLELKMDRGGASGWASPDPVLFERAARTGVMIAKDPGVRFYSSAMMGIGVGRSGAAGSTWEDEMATKNAEAIEQRKRELGIGGN